MNHLTRKEKTMKRTTRHLTATLLGLMMLLNLTPPPARAAARGLTISEPSTNGDRYDAPPVAITVHVGGDARRFRATLNDRDVTGMFRPHGAGAWRAVFTAEHLKEGRNPFEARLGWRRERRSFRVRSLEDGDPSPDPSQALYVPIQTRVITGDGTQASDYAIRVGDQTYQAPALSGGGATGFQYLVLDRQTFELKTNQSFPMNSFEDAGAMIAGVSYPECGEFGCLVVVQSLQMMGWNPRCDIDPACYSGIPTGLTPGDAVSALGDDTFRLDNVNGYSPHAAYSLISNVKGANGGASATTRLTCDFEGVNECYNQNVTLSNDKGVISGALVLDNNFAYTFASPRRATFETGTDASLTSNTMTINGTAYQSDTIPAGSGAFHVVMVYRDTLALYSNQTFDFDHLYNGADQTDPQTMFGALDTAANNRHLLAFVTSIDNLWHDNWPFEWSLIGKTIEKMGGTYSVFLDLQGGDDYTFVGAMDTTRGDGAVEASSIVSRATRPTVRPSNVRGVLAPDTRGNYRPTLSRLTSTDPNQDSSLADFTLAQLDAIAFQPQTPWPAMTAGQQAAYNYLSEKLCCLDIRAAYTNDNIAPSTWLSGLDELTYPSGGGFTQEDFDRVKAQLMTEINYVADIRTFQSNIQTLYTDEQTGINTILQTASDAVVQSVQPPASSSATPKWLSVLEGVMTVAGDVSSFAGQPEIQLAMDLTVVGMNTAMAFTNDSTGNNVQNIETTVDTLLEKSETDFNASLTTLGNLFDLILTDWGRLQKLGQPLMSNQIQWDDSIEGAVLNGMDRALRREYFPELMAAGGIQLGWWTNIQEGSPPDLTALRPFTSYETCRAPDGGDCFCEFHSPSSDPENWVTLPSNVVNNPQSNDDGRQYDIWFLGLDPFCSANKNGDLLKDIFAPIDPDDPTKLGVYKPYFFLDNSQGVGFGSGSFPTGENWSCGKQNGSGGCGVGQIQFRAPIVTGAKIQTDPLPAGATTSTGAGNGN